jgi:hypothetical protein
MTDSGILSYRFATSAVQFSGTQTQLAHEVDSGKKEYDSEANLIVRADISVAATTLAIDHHFADSKLSLGLTDDGRLTSTSLDLTGIGSDLLGSVASIAGELAPIIAATAEFVKKPDSNQAPSNGKYAQADLLASLKSAQNDLADALVAASSKIAASYSDGGQQGSAGISLEVLKTALEIAGDQIDRLTKEQVAWNAAGKVVKKCTYVVDLGDLPTGEDLKPPELGPAAKTVWDDLGIMVSVVNLQSYSGNSSQDISGNRIYYRIPRRARLLVWRRVKGSHECIESNDAEIVDKNSEHNWLPLGKDGFFGRDNVSVTIGSLGAPTLISSDHESAVSSAAAALAGAPKLISTGISDMTGISTAWQAAYPSPSAKATAALQAQKDRLQVISDIVKLGGTPQV